MERETREDGAFLFFGARQFVITFDGRKENGSSVSVEVVANDGMTEGLHVYADLVCAAGMDAKLDEGIEMQLFEDLVVGERRFAATVGDHGAGFARMFHDGQVDGAFWLGEGAMDNSLIQLFCRAVLEDA